MVSFRRIAALTFVMFLAACGSEAPPPSSGAGSGGASGPGNGGDPGSGGSGAGGAGTGSPGTCGGTCCDQTSVPAAMVASGQDCLTAVKKGCADHGSYSEATFNGQLLSTNECHDCRVSCCNGEEVKSGADSTEAACIAFGGFDCGSEGPTKIEYNGDTVWTSSGACPTLKSCRVTCCDGEEKESTAYDQNACVFFSVADDPNNFCNAHGGPGSVEFDGGIVWNDNKCSSGNYNCIASCCDGSVSYSLQNSSGACTFFGSYSCEKDGGPSNVTYGGQDVFDSNVSCPTARDCVVRCCDGTEVKSTSFSSNMCVFYNVNAHCGGHGGDDYVSFSGSIEHDVNCP